MTVQFLSLSSGSCGNCYFLVCKETGLGVLIDAGVSFRKMKKTLELNGYGLDNVCALFVTHDHFDHIRNLDYFCGKMSRPVYATATLHNALANHPFAALKTTAVKRPLAEGEWNDVTLHSPVNPTSSDDISRIPPSSSAQLRVSPAPSAEFSVSPAAPSAQFSVSPAPSAEFRVRPFVVPHDATQTVGYAFDFFGCNFVIMTDVGRVTPEALTLASAADALVIESNYDLRMLIAGPYPKELRDRITGGHGHLSNDECASAISRIWHPGLTNIFLCHLSENNNTPELAYEASRDALDAALAAASAAYSASSPAPASAPASASAPAPASASAPASAPVASAVFEQPSRQPSGRVLFNCSLRCLPRRYPSQLFTL